MSGWGWFLLGAIYLVLLFTLAVMTFRRGHWILGLIGFFSRSCGSSARSCPDAATARGAASSGRGRRASFEALPMVL
jgi:hypothetical protein